MTLAEAPAEARLNAIRAVELDPVRRHERMLDVRLAAAVLLAPRIEIAEALLAGVTVSADRLNPWFARGLRGEVTLTDALALRVNAGKAEGGDGRAR